MNKSNKNITMKGNPVAVTGLEVTEGNEAPSFKLTAQDMSDISLESFSGKVLTILAFPSVDTPVCATETKKFNELAASLSDDVAILAVSMDLPFAQKRFCAAEGISAVQTGSDFKHRTFGENYGVLLSEIGIFARAVFVIDRDKTIKHVEYVTEIAEEPDYDAAIGAIKSLL